MAEEEEEEVNLIKSNNDLLRSGLLIGQRKKKGDMTMTDRLPW